MAADEVSIIVEAKVTEALKNLGLVVKETQKMAEPSLYDKIKKNWLSITAGIVSAFVTIKKAFDLAAEFADFDEQARAMEQRFGVSSREVIAHLTKMSNGMVSAKDIISGASKAMALGVTTDIGTLGKLMELATAQADVFGISNEEAFDAIVTGIGKGTPRILESVGLQTDAWAAEAKAAGVAMDSHFLLNKVLEKGAEISEANSGASESLADKMDRMRAVFDNVRLKSGELVVDFFSPMIESMEQTSGGADKLGSTIDRVFKFIAAAAVIVRLNFIGMKNGFELMAAPIFGMGKAIVDFYKIATDDSKSFVEKLTAFGAVGINAIKNTAASVVTDVEDMGNAFVDAKEKIDALFSDTEEAPSVPRITPGPGEKEGTGAEIPAVKARNAEDAANEEIALANKVRDAKKRAAYDVLNSTKETLDAAFAIAERNAAGDKRQLREIAKAKKAAGIIQAIINTSLSIGSTFAQLGFTPWGIASAVAASVAGTAQVAMIASQQIPAFAQGGSLVTDGPQLFMAGDNPSGRERIDVTPLSASGEARPTGNTYIFNGIQDIAAARDALMQQEGRRAFA